MTTATLETPSTSWRISWGAIFGGTVAALGVWILLYAFGLAIGLSSVDEITVESLRTAGIGTGIWGAVAPLIALFIGGYVAARSAGHVDRGVALLHGLVLWGFTTLVSLTLLGMSLNALLGGVVNLTGKAVQTAASGAAAGTAEATGEGGILETLGLSTADLMAPINRELAAEGKPQVTADQLQAAAQDSVQTALRTGRLDRDMLTAALARNTGLSGAQTQDLATRIETAFNAQRSQLASRAQDAGSRATQATGRAFWGIFFALLLGLVAALGGAALGAFRRQDVIRTRVPLITTQPITGAT